MKSGGERSRGGEGKEDGEAVTKRKNREGWKQSSVLGNPRGSFEFQTEDYFRLVWPPPRPSPAPPQSVLMSLLLIPPWSAVAQRGSLVPKQISFRDGWAAPSAQPRALSHLPLVWWKPRVGGWGGRRFSRGHAQESGRSLAALSIILKPSRSGSDHVRRGKTSGCISTHKRRAPLRFPSVSCSHPVNFPRALFLLSLRFSSASQAFLQVLPFQQLNRNPLQPFSPHSALLPSTFPRRLFPLSVYDGHVSWGRQLAGCRLAAMATGTLPLPKVSLATSSLAL